MRLSLSVIDCVDLTAWSVCVITVTAVVAHINNRRLLAIMAVVVAAAAVVAVEKIAIAVAMGQQEEGEGLGTASYAEKDTGATTYGTCSLPVAARGGAGKTPGSASPLDMLTGRRCISVLCSYQPLLVLALAVVIGNNVYRRSGIMTTRVVTAAVVAVAAVLLTEAKG